MKLYLGLTLSYIHPIFYFTMAQVWGQTLGFNPLLTFAISLLAIPVSLFPLIRTIAMLALLLFLVPWWKAILLTMAFAAALLFIEGLGETMLKTIQPRRI
jgi:hypothetical protein